MIRSKRFATERAADFIRELLSDTVTHFFQLFLAFHYYVTDRVLQLLSFVYMSRIDYFCQWLFFLIWSVC